MILNIFFTLVLIYFFVTIFLYFYQDKLLYHPNVNARSSYELDHKVDEILIPSDNDLIAWHYKNKENFKTLVFFHGNAGDLSNRIYKLNELSKLKLNYLIFAYRGFNGSKGKPSEKGLYEDAENILYWLKSNKIFENNIIIYGESLGTAIAVHIAQNKNFSGIILEAPFTSMIELGQKYYPIFPVKFLLKDKYESFKKINKIKSPVLVMHGKKDKIVPFYMGKQIFEILPSPKFSYFNEQDDHMMEYNQDLIDSIKNFINQLS
tara:strand:- start:336 stop:1124 length:789 start_codon:yes stop_codon:yes gene_type:complete